MSNMNRSLRIHSGRRSLMRSSVTVTALLLLTGCASFSPDKGMSVVAGVTDAAIRKDVISIRSDDDARFAEETVGKLKARTLTVDTAVQISLLNNRGLQATYNELALAEADMVADSLPPNPSFSVSRSVSGGTVEVSRQVAGDILAIATLPFRSEIARERFKRAQLAAAEQTLRLAADVRDAFYRVAAANELVAVLTEAKTIAETTAQLATKLGETGSLNKLDQARQQAFYAETTADLASAKQEAASSRERLIRLLGLWGRDINIKLPGTLPQLPRKPQTLPLIEVNAVERRLDLQMARIDLLALAKSLELTQATRFVTLLDMSGSQSKELGSPNRSRSVGIDFQIPIFDGGEVRVRQSAEIYNQAFNLLTEKAINVRSEARNAFQVYRSTYDIALQYQREVLPLRQVISEEMQLRYSSMQIDVFALVVEATARIAAQRAGVAAKRDFWLANSALQTAVNGGGRGESPSQTTGTTTAQASAGGGH